MVSGASATGALVLAPLVREHGSAAMPLAVACAGLVQLLVGYLRGGRLVRMLPHPVVLGFVNGLAVKVILAQVDHFQHPHGVWLQGAALGWHTGLAALSFAIIEGTPRRVSKLVPAPLLAMAATLGLATFFMPPAPRLRDVVGAEAFAGGLESLRAAFPALERPTATAARAAVAAAGEFAAVGLLQSLLTLQLVDGLTRGNAYGRGHASQECRALGLGNLISGLCGGMGGCGLLGQSLVNISAGGTGRASAVAYVLFVALGLTCFGSLMGAIPVGALVGLMLAVARHTFSWSSVRLLYGRRVGLADAVTILGVSLLTVRRGLAVAVVVGVVATALRFCWDSCNDLYSAHEVGGSTRTVDLFGTLFFGDVCGPRAADGLGSRLCEFLAPPLGPADCGSQLPPLPCRGRVGDRGA